MRYSLRKIVAALWGALTCMAVLGSPQEARADTTYFYDGSPYSEIHTGIINVGNCLFPPACTYVPNPNAAADAAKFGTNMTGAVTFDFDTTGVTGSFGLNDITNLSLVSGVYSVTTNFNVVSFSLTNGLITDWVITAGGGFTVSCDFSNGTKFCGWQSSGSDHPFLAAAGDLVTQICPSCGDAIFFARSSTPGTWVVPFPPFGSGLPGLLFASAGLLAWWRRRQKST